MFKKYVPKPGRREYITFLLLFLEIVLFGIFAPNFLTVSNLVRVVQNNAEIAIVSIGMTIVMLLGGIDLSVGSVMGVIAIVIGYMLQADINILLIAVVAICIGIGLGLVNGFLVAKFNIPDMIVTLATMNIWKAAIFALLGGKWLTGLNPSYGVITRARVLGIPVLLLFIIGVYAVFYYFLMYRRFGRHIYATGCNPQSANLSGINIAGVKMVSYCISGGIVAIAAMLYIARMGSVEMTIGSDLPIACIAAVTIGGTGSKGGGKRGSVIGTLAGVLFIAFLKNGIVILGIPSLLENCFIGLLIIISVVISLAAGAALGAVNGVLIAMAGVPALIATLGTQYVYSSLALYLTGGIPISGFPESFEWLSLKSTFGIPNQILFVVIPVTILVFILIYKMKFGRRAYLMGTNPEAAKFTGIREVRIRMGIYILAGVLAAISAVINNSWLMTARADAGTGMEMQAITVAVLGGISVAGGSGHLGGVLIGVIIITMMNSGLQIANINSVWQLAVLGLILILAIILNHMMNKFVIRVEKNRE